MEINKYPDGSSYVTSNSGDPAIFRINSYEDLWHLNQYVDAFKSRNPGCKPTLLIPNLIDAQADRRFNKDESFGLKLVCEFLNNMKANFKIFHPHNPEVVEALMDNVEIIDNSKFINKVFAKLAREVRAGGRYFDEPSLNTFDLKENLILMSSDAGGFKPLMKLCDKLNWQGQTYSASKSRLWDGKESKLVQQIQCKDFENKDILIIDDLCSYGGTFKGLSKMLRERNVGKLYLAVSHMTVQDLGEDPVTNYFNKVFTTNSKYDNYKVNYNNTSKGTIDDLQPRNLEIIQMF